MPLARIGQSLLFFVHIPKTGGSSIESYLAAKGSLALRHAKDLGWSKCSVQHIHAAIYRPLIRAGFYDHGFAILRDPVARLTSEYRYRAGQAARRAGKQMAPFDDWVARSFLHYERNPYVLDNHIRPQAEFVVPGLQLFRFEAGLEPVFDWIDDVTGDATAAPREWRLKTDAPEVDIAPATDAAIRAFYAVDYALMAQQGWTGAMP